MAKDVHPPRGMRDFLPLEKSRRDNVLGRIRETYLGHGFQEIETPALEDLSRLTSGQGGDNEKLAFRVMKRGAELESALLEANGETSDGLADLGLRYDLTVPLTRYFATNRSKLPAVFKSLQTGPVWRAERPQKGRYRQFVQCDIDIIGDATVLAEIELLNASLDALAAIGLNDATIRVNHRGILVGLLEHCGFEHAIHGKVLISVDKLDKVGVAGVAKELTDDFGDIAQVQKLVAALERFASAGNHELSAQAIGALVGESATAEQIETLTTIGEAIAARFGKKRLRFDPTLVRGMGYYTGSIFEIEHPESGSSIGGGGRYDGMVGRWLGQDSPAVGISIGFERAIELVSANTDEVKAVVLVLDDAEATTIGNALNLQVGLIDQGFRVRLEQRPKKLNILLESMAEQGFSSFATVGQELVDLSALNIRPLN